MKPTHTRTDAQLNAYAEEHVQYEFDMLMWSTTVLVALAPHQHKGFLPWAVHNGLLNTFAVHARNLVTFCTRRTAVALLTSCWAITYQPT